MRRRAYPELHGRPRRRRHRREPERDRILLGLKIGTFLAAAGLIAMVILLTTGGSDVADRVAEQRIGAESPPPDDAPPSTAPRPVSPPTVIAPPTVRTETAHIAGPSSTPPSPSQPPPPQTAPEPQFAVIGEPCPEVGAFATTRNRESVMCYPPTRGGTSRWNRVF